MQSKAGDDQNPDIRLAELARLLPLWPDELSDMTPAGRARLVAKLERALKAERRRGRAGHWTYDLARHAALLDAWRREREALRKSERAETGRSLPAVHSIRPAAARRRSTVRG